MLHFCHCQYEQNVFQYQGAEIHRLAIDELTTFTEFQYDYLRGRVRCTIDIPKEYQKMIPGIACASNPGGVGHEFAKRRWVDYGPAGQIQQAPPVEGGMRRIYIPALLHDNPTLAERDPGYINRLDALPEPYRTAYKNGDWNIFIGQAFPFSQEYHVTEPLSIPNGAPIYTTFDWGFGAPFSWGWWWVDNDGRIFRFAEIYGWNGTPNQGLRWEDSRIAEEILRKEAELAVQYKISFRDVIRKASPDCFNKKPDYKGGGQGPSTAEVFAKMGIYLTPGDPNRRLKFSQFRERLKVPKDGEGKQAGLPMMMVYSVCDQFIRTVPMVQSHPTNKEEIDDQGECHAVDDSCHICMARPINLQAPKPVRTLGDIRIDYIENAPRDTYEDFAARDQKVDEVFWGHVQNINEGEPVVEGRVYSDVDGR